jgi:hypothetical protein
MIVANHIILKSISVDVVSLIYLKYIKENKKKKFTSNEIDQNLSRF